MSAMSIGQGLTQLRKYDFGQTGFFYSSLLQLSTGIERLIKLILIYTYRINNNDRFPGNSELKSYGHNLNDLFSKSAEIASGFDFENLKPLNLSDQIFEKIIHLLSDFAMQARYYNLDTLTGRQQRTNIEPLARWEADINSLIIERHFRPRKKTLQQWEFVINSLSDKSHVMHTAESGAKIDTFRQLAEHGMKSQTKQKYCMYYCY